MKHHPGDITALEKALCWYENSDEHEPGAKALPPHRRHEGGGIDG